MVFHLLVFYLFLCLFVDIYIFIYDSYSISFFLTKKTRALEGLIETEFLHAIDAPSLALIVPILHRGLRDRGAATKRYGALIAGNICVRIVCGFVFYLFIYLFVFYLFKYTYLYDSYSNSFFFTKKDDDQFGERLCPLFTNTFTRFEGGTIGPDSRCPGHFCEGSRLVDAWFGR